MTNEVTPLIIRTCVLQDCDWITGQPTLPLALYLRTWHIHDDHPDVWEWLCGANPPGVPDPRIPAVRIRMLAGLQ